MFVILIKIAQVQIFNTVGRVGMTGVTETMCIRNYT